MADANITLKDGTNTSFLVKARQLADGSYSMYHASRSQVLQPDSSTVDMVGTTMSKFSDGFSGPTLAAGQETLDSLSKWNIVRNTGVTVQQINGALTIASGTASGNEFLLVGKTGCTIPQNLIVTLAMSARVANQELRIGYLEVDATTGLPVANPNLANFFNNHCAVLFSGTTSTTVSLETLSGANPTTKVVAATSQTASTATLEYALEVRPEDVTYQQATADSVTTKNISGARVSSMVPAPTVIYAPFIWLRNTGTATSTTTTVQRVVSMDIQELQVEVGGGRGNLAASQAIPVVQVAAGTTQTVTVGSAIPAGTNTIGNVNLANSVVAATSNGGATPVKINNAATTNLTLVKSTGAKLWGGIVYNSNTTAVYIRLFNAASAAAVTLGTTAPLVVLPIAPNDTVNISAIVDQYGMNFTTGLVYAITAGAADLDTTALTTANTVVGTLFYV